MTTSMKATMNGNTPLSLRGSRPPRVVVAGLASCFGCQLQITSQEDHLLDILGQIDLDYWQLASSEPMPDDFDVAVIEGAVTTEQSAETVRRLRERASAVIAIGACANTAGIPGIAANRFEERTAEVYDGIPSAAGDMIVPRRVADVIDVDFQVLCCPIDFADFTAVLSKALYGSNRSDAMRTMCGDCKRAETTCFYARGTVCMGLVTKAACGARCLKRNRPCNGCAGLSPDANLESARRTVRKFGLDTAEFDERLQLFNRTDPAIDPANDTEASA